MAYISHERENWGNYTMFRFENCPAELQCDRNGYAKFVPIASSDGLSPQFYIHSASGRKYRYTYTSDYVFPFFVKHNYHLSPV